MAQIDNIDRSSDDFDNIIIPQRYIPFDLGTRIDKECSRRIEDYFREKSYEVKEIPGLLKSISLDVLFRVEISVARRLYIYSYGIGVFMIEDENHLMSDKYAVEYCDSRKKAHKEYLNFEREGVSEQIKNIIDDLRKIVAEKKKDIRPSASADWEHKGLSYVMTVSYIVKKDLNP